MTKINRSFALRQIPSPPSSSLLKSLSKAEADKVFSEWEELCDEILESRRKLFHKDLRRMNICNWVAVLSGHNILSQNRYHFSWCPHED
jgi:hypothetical protein